jgi:transcriptional regulator with XRE-family HTH domain
MVSTNRNLFIRHFRQQRGLTIAQLAELSGLHRNTVAQVERGRLNPTTDELQKLADALNFSPAARLLREVTIVIPEDDAPREVHQ